MPLMDVMIVGLMVIALSGLRVAQESERGAIFRLGRYQRLRGSGLCCIRTRTVSAEQQETITRESVTINIIGQHDLDEILQERDKITTLLSDGISGSTVKSARASAQITANPAALELRRRQMIAEVGAENNSTTVLMIASDFVSLAHGLNDCLQRQSTSTGAT